MTDRVQHNRLEPGLNNRRTGSLARFWLALFVLVVICAFAVYRSALFRLESIQVSGLMRLSEPRIMEIAELMIGAPRWENAAAEIESRLRREPLVREAKAEWRWNRLFIKIIESEPIGLLRFHEVYYVAVDENGLILEQVDASATPKMVVISGVSAEGTLRGEGVEHQGLRDVLTVLAAMAKPLRDQLSEVHVTEDRTITFFMSSGATVRWGHVPDGNERLLAVEQKIKLFGEFWGSLSGKRTAQCQIDMRVEGRVIPAGCE